MRIAFTGTHRVGKTTLAQEITDSLPDFMLMDEPYHQLQESGYLFSEEPSLDDYRAQFDFAIKQLAHKDNQVILDRCPLDLLAYIHISDRSQDISALYETMLNALSSLDLIVFVPIESPDLIFCTPDDLPRLRQKVNDVLESWLTELQQPIISVSGTLAQRKKQVLDAIVKL